MTTNMVQFKLFLLSYSTRQIEISSFYEVLVYINEFLLLSRYLVYDIIKKKLMLSCINTCNVYVGTEMWGVTENEHIKRLTQQTSVIDMDEISQQISS